MSGMYQSLISSSPWQQAQNTHGLTIFLSVHWGAPEEQTPTGIAESLRQHHQSLPLVWLIFINVGQKCDNCDESFYSEEELSAHIKIVHKNPPTGVVADHCLELKSVEREKEKDLWRRQNRFHCYPHSHPSDRQHPCVTRIEKIPVAKTLCKESQLWTDFSQEEEENNVKGAKDSRAT